MKIRKFRLFLAVLVVAGIWGCGSNRSSDSSTTPVIPIEDAATTGNCTLCHTLDVHTKFSGLVGQNPDMPLGLGSAITHDCEDCHGGGQYHHGTGPIPFPKPTVTRCATCHTTQVEKVLASKHNGEDPTNTTLETTGHTSDGCQACHTLEGYIEYAKVTTDGGLTGYTPLNPAPTTFHWPGCAACHEPLNASLRKTPNWDPNSNGASDQFDMCTSCHKLVMPDGTPIASGLTVGPVGFEVSTVEMVQHKKDWYRNITTTHYDLATTGVGTGATNLIEGYNVRMNGDSACTDCHGHELFTDTGGAAGSATTPGEATTIHTQWAGSGHAGSLLKTKIAKFAELGYARTTATSQAIMSAGSLGSEYAWNHYPWSDTNSRGDCQMCHTSTGYMNYVKDPANYDFADNDFSHLKGWTAAAPISGQAELLYCWGCHTSVETGELRVVAPVTATYTFNGQPIVFPDAGKSNSCVVCHSGRGNNEVVSTSSRFAGHHAPAAATLFAVNSHVAYEYPGLSYTPPVYFAHNSIDVNGSGPCAGCHMDGAAANHTFEVVEKDLSNVITAINADLCVTCHDGEHALFVGKGLVGQTVNIWNGTAAVPTVVTQLMVDQSAAVLEEEAEGYKEAGTLLTDLLKQTNGLSNYTGAVINNTNIAVNDLGAYQNSLLPGDDPGGFAHNRFYVKRVIFDAIDWVEDGAINGTIANYTVNYPAAAAWLGTTRP